jgi:diguanylate cyclase (GGDEF)-like protein
MQELATRDSLTGLYNRHYLDEKLADEFNRASRYGHPLSLAICDIDFFKSINDTFTHEVGDETLKRLARLIESNVRITDIVARYGGEEFVIVFIETPIARAIGVCEALCQAISSHDWSSIHPKLNVTVSIGVAGNDQVIRYEKLLHEADIKLYEAKHQGKNRVCY